LEYSTQKQRLYYVMTNKVDVVKQEI